MAWLRRVRFLTPNLRLLVFIVPVGLVGLSLWLGPIRDIPGYDFGVHLSPIALFLISAAGASLSLDMRIHRIPITLSLTEVSLILGLFLVPPYVLIVTTVLGVAVAHWVRRGIRPTPDIANVCVDTFYIAIAVLFMHALPVDQHAGLSAANAAILGATVIVAGTILPLIVNVGIWFYSAEINVRNTLTAVEIELVASLVNACLGVIGLVFVLYHWWLAAVLVPPVGLVYLSQVASTERQMQARRIQFMFEMSELLHNSNNLIGQSNELLEQLARTVEGERCELLVFTEHGRVLRIRSDAASDAERVVSTELTAAERALLDELPLRDGVIGDGPDAPAAMHTVLHEHGARRGVAAVMSGSGDPLGVVLVMEPAVARGRRGRIPAATLHVVNSVAAQIGAALEKGHLADEVRVMSRERVELNRRLFHDPLTRLANRMLFQDRLTHALATAARYDSPVGVLFIDLDNFKSVNDTYGHDVGDELLVAVAKRLRECTREADTPARFSGDEFGVLSEQMVSTDDVINVAERIVLSLAQPHHLRDGVTVTVRASVGVAVVTPSTGPNDVSEVIRWADTAMYVAKRRGKGSYAIFEPGMDGAVSQRLAFEVEMRRALASEELFLQYQPIISIRDKRIVGAEALVRWMHPTRGQLPPGDFIPLAEETGFVVPLGHWVLEAVCRKLVEWEPLIADRPFYVSLNVSAQELLVPDFQEGVEEVIRRSGVNPSRLVFEVTESALLVDMAAAKARLGELRDFGLRVALDDFGTGFSSLSYLHDLPADILKIDRCFLAKRRDDDRHREFLRAIYTLGHSLGLSTVAEGVEEMSDLEILSRFKVEYAQGYHIARPMNADAFTERIGGVAPVRPHAQYAS